MHAYMVINGHIYLSEDGAERGHLVHGEGDVHVAHPHVAGGGHVGRVVELAAVHRRRLRVRGHDLGERPQQRVQLGVQRLLRPPRRLLHVARPRRLLLRQRLHMPDHDLRSCVHVGVIERVRGAGSIRKKKRR